jgi:dTDP-4-dehydrorhamnose 3,5-epimerase
MLFTELSLAGAYIIDLEKREDSRGFFGRTYCRREFEEHGLAAQMPQSNVSFSTKRGTLRGMHYQEAPYEEAKLVRCTRGAIYDVIIDVRPSASTFGEWTGVELTGENHRMLYVPEGFAHGFITLVDDTEVTYQVSQFYAPGHERGLCYNDPSIGIEWPLDVSVISDKDERWPAFNPSIPENI